MHHQNIHKTYTPYIMSSKRNEPVRISQDYNFNMGLAAQIAQNIIEEQQKWSTSIHPWTYILIVMYAYWQIFDVINQHSNHLGLLHVAMRFLRRDTDPEEVEIMHERAFENWAIRYWHYISEHFPERVPASKWNMELYTAAGETATTLVSALLKTGDPESYITDLDDPDRMRNFINNAFKNRRALELQKIDHGEDIERDDDNDDDYDQDGVRRYAMPKTKKTINAQKQFLAQSRKRASKAPVRKAGKSSATAEYDRPVTNEDRIAAVDRACCKFRDYLKELLTL